MFLPLPFCILVTYWLLSNLFSLFLTYSFGSLTKTRFTLMAFFFSSSSSSSSSCILLFILRSFFKKEGKGKARVWKQGAGGLEKVFLGRSVVCVYVFIQDSVCIYQLEFLQFAEKLLVLTNFWHLFYFAAYLGRRDLEVKRGYFSILSKEGKNNILKFMALINSSFD